MENVKRLIESLKITKDGSVFTEEKRLCLTVPSLITYGFKFAPEQKVGRNTIESIYRMGFSDYGEEFAASNKNSGLKETLGSLLNLFTSYGWGRMELLNCDEEKLEVSFRVYSSIYGEEYTGYFKSEKVTSYPACPYGYAVEGVLSAFSKRKDNPTTFFSNEVKCIAKGDEYCEFVVKPL
jgi:predicted hydrocarbon binding protein